MVRSESPSVVAISGEFLQEGMPLLSFLTLRFPAISEDVWRDRFNRQLILTYDEVPVAWDCPVFRGERYKYFREVAEEIEIPFEETVLFSNNDLIVVDKPHFLPVTPAGSYIENSLLNRLKKRFSNPDITTINRIDRLTAGVVLFSANRESTHLYKELFVSRNVQKEYLAGARIENEPPLRFWRVENRLEPSGELFLMHAVPGAVNAISEITYLGKKGDLGCFSVTIHSGKRHQIRVHMSGLGFPIENDNFYPTLLPKDETLNFAKPLRLISKKTSFIDPITNDLFSFESSYDL